LLAVFNDVKAACGDSAASTLASLTGHLYKMYTLIRTEDNCTDGKFTYSAEDFAT